MAGGMYTAPERVVRDGVLVCFAGERMTMEDARRRGLLEEPAPADPDARLAELTALSAKELAAHAARIGAVHAKGANKQTVARAIIAKESGK